MIDEFNLDAGGTLGLFILLGFVYYDDFIDTRKCFSIMLVALGRVPSFIFIIILCQLIKYLLFEVPKSSI